MTEARMPPETTAEKSLLISSSANPSSLAGMVAGQPKESAATALLQDARFATH
jgi:hypothetical protein